MKSYINNEDPLCILDIDIQPQTVGNSLLDAQDLLCLDVCILHQIRKRPLLHLSDIGRDCDIKLCRLHRTLVAVQYKAFEYLLHIFNIRDHPIAERI